MVHFFKVFKTTLLSSSSKQSYEMLIDKATCVFFHLSNWILARARGGPDPISAPFAVPHVLRAQFTAFLFTSSAWKPAQFFITLLSLAIKGKNRSWKNYTMPLTRCPNEVQQPRRLRVGLLALLTTIKNGQKCNAIKL